MSRTPYPANFPGWQRGMSRRSESFSQHYEVRVGQAPIFKPPTLPYALHHALQLPPPESRYVAHPAYPLTAVPRALQSPHCADGGIPNFQDVEESQVTRSDDTRVTTPESKSISSRRYRYIEEQNGSLLVVPVDAIDLSLTRSRSRSASSELESSLPADWPPHDVHSQYLTRDQARRYISRGAPVFQGTCREVPYIKNQFHFFVLPTNGWDDEGTDSALFQEDFFHDMSDANRPQDSLDRPYMRNAFGYYPGTITLAAYAASFGCPLDGGPPLDGGTVKLRKLNMNYVVARLRKLKHEGIEDRDPTLLYHELYANLLYDGITRADDPHRFEMGRQVYDLIDVLARPEWIDFSRQENQIVPEFFYRDDSAGNNKFFHQLLLSLELFLRITSRSPLNNSLGQTYGWPVKVRYDLVLAQRWLENVEIESSPSAHPAAQSTVTFHFQNKNTQVDILRNFGWTLKWPNMPEVEFILSEVDAKEKAVEDRSVSCMSWFTGLMLPGRTMPWVIMKTLIDCDPDAPPSIRTLSHLAPNAGIQWRGSTYWSWECIVGRVLGAAKGVRQMCGWLGPLPTSPELHRSEVVLINQSPPLGHLTPSDIHNMAANSEAFPDHEASVHVDDFDMIEADLETPTDNIRIERLNFQPATSTSQTVMRILPPGSQKPPRPPSSISGRSASGRSTSSRSISGRSNFSMYPGDPTLYDASITFAISSKSWRVYLRHDTPFIAAYPCRNGPHVLYNAYDFRVVRPDKLTEIKNWGSNITDASNDGESEAGGSEMYYNNEVEEVLVIEAFGVCDNEVFARAWCSYWGLAAIVADVDRTCVACAVREAYAGFVKVVILNCARLSLDNEVEDVDRTILEV
ncbi:hypothetical protein Dda_4616 [Drechslerella dactyloides]|uniref:Uncharacterized protein n=1 Tax=Drechslerella dactyloides TaxID=74499 RepID=A0AAD6IXA0_DREDA|nr:hypothetical protein Dda_4616 [Drechslerella dactyloides]